jgi:hypothetical protein
MPTASHHAAGSVWLGPPGRCGPRQRRGRAGGVSGRPCSGLQLRQHRARVLWTVARRACRYGDAKVSQSTHSRSGLEQRRPTVCRRVTSSMGGHRERPQQRMARRRIDAAALVIEYDGAHSRADAIHSQAGSVPRVHLLLQQDSRHPTGRSRFPAVFPGHAACRASDDQDAPCARIHRPRTGEGTLNQAPTRSCRIAGFGLTSAERVIPRWTAAAAAHSSANRSRLIRSRFVIKWMVLSLGYRPDDPRRPESDLRTPHLSLDVTRTSENASGVV